MLLLLRGTKCVTQWVLITITLYGVASNLFPRFRGAGYKPVTDSKFGETHLFRRIQAYYKVLPAEFSIMHHAHACDRK